MAIIKLARQVGGRELIDIIQTTAREQSFKFFEPNNYSPEYRVYRKCYEFNPSARGIASDIRPDLGLFFPDLKVEGTYLNLRCRTEVSTMVRNPVKLQGEYAKYMPYFDRFVEEINAKLAVHRNK